MIFVKTKNLENKLEYSDMEPEAFVNCWTTNLNHLDSDSEEAQRSAEIFVTMKKVENRENKPHCRKIK